MRRSWWVLKYPSAATLLFLRLRQPNKRARRDRPRAKKAPDSRTSCAHLEGHINVVDAVEKLLDMAETNDEVIAFLARPGWHGFMAPTFTKPIT